MKDISIPKIKANQIISSLGISSPDHLKYLNEICIELGAKVEYDSISGSEGRLVSLGDSAIITVPTNEKYAGRTRFSVAHELGHFTLHRQNSSFFLCTQQDLYRGWNETVEREANEFAAELLLPSFLVKAEIKREVPSFEMAKGLASQFSTSLMPAVFKYIENTPHGAAAVLYSRNKVMYVSKSKVFEENYLRIEYGNLDKNSVAFRFALDGKTQKDKAKVHAEAWSTSEYFRGRYFIEESEFYSNLGIGMSILVLA